MRVFVTGTDTDVGKTIICSWLCAHTKYAYFKPIQCGNRQDVDAQTVKKLSGVETYEEIYSFREPVSPHLAARLANQRIDLNAIRLPAAAADNLIVEGAGGLCVPLNDHALMIDLVRRLRTPAILVARTTLGTINHTLLSLNALRQRHVPVLGIILNGDRNEDNRRAIEFYGNAKVLATFPALRGISTRQLMQVEFGDRLKTLFDTR